MRVQRQAQGTTSLAALERKDQALSFIQPRREKSPIPRVLPQAVKYGVALAGASILYFGTVGSAKAGDYGLFAAPDPNYRTVQAWTVNEQNFRPENIYWPRGPSGPWFCATFQISKDDDSLIISGQPANAPNNRLPVAYTPHQDPPEAFGVVGLLGIGAFVIFVGSKLFGGSSSSPGRYQGTVGPERIPSHEKTMRAAEQAKKAETRAENLKQWKADNPDRWFNFD